MATSIQEYSETEAGLARLRGEYAGAVYEVAAPGGMRLAIAARAELRDLRVSLEKRRVEIKAPALERCRQIDAEAKRITAELVALEDPIDGQIKAEEAKRAAEREAKRFAEVERLRAEAEAQEAAARAERLAAEQAERERLDAIAAEERRIAAEHLAAERAEAQRAREQIEREQAALRAEQEAAAAERARLDAIAAAEREEADRVARVERDRLARIEDERLAVVRRDIAAERARLDADEAYRAEQERIEQAQRLASMTLLEAAAEACDLLVAEGYEEHPAAVALAAAIDREIAGSDAARVAA